MDKELFRLVNEATGLYFIFQDNENIFKAFKANGDFYAKCRSVEDIKEAIWHYKIWKNNLNCEPEVGDIIPKGWRNWKKDPCLYKHEIFYIREREESGRHRIGICFPSMPDYESWLVYDINTGEFLGNRKEFSLWKPFKRSVQF